MKKILFLTSCSYGKKGSGLANRCAMWLYILEKRGYNVEYCNYYENTKNIKVLSSLKRLGFSNTIVNVIHFGLTFFKRRKYIIDTITSGEDVFIFRINPLLSFSTFEMRRLLVNKLNNIFIDLDESEYCSNINISSLKFLNYIYQKRVFIIEKTICSIPEIIKYFSSEEEVKKVLSIYLDSLNLIVETNKIDSKIPRLMPKMLNSPIELLVLGDFKYKPNEEMLEKLIQYHYEESTFKNFIIHVVGNGISLRIKSLLCSFSSVKIHGFVSDEELKKLFMSVDFLFAPIFSGGGTKYKLIEATAYGLPSITTEKGVEGINMKSNIHYISFKTSGDIVKVVNINDFEYNNLRSQCFDLFQSKYMLR